MSTNDYNDIFIGIDGGATKTKGVLFDIEGTTLATSTAKGSNLTVYLHKGVERISSIIEDLINKSKIDIESIRCIGLGIAGSSSKDGRDLLFKELDRIRLSNKSLLTNDAEAAYEICCPNNQGLLVTVGTGIICVGKNDNGKLFRTAGKGHYSGDVGSGFWIGYQSILKLSMNDDICMNNPVDSKELLNTVYAKLEISNLDQDLQEIIESSESVSKVASLSKDIIDLASRENEVALSIVQEASTAVADYIIDLSDKLNYKSKKIILSANGSVIKNSFFRQSLNDALQFNFYKINWLFSKISPAYGAAILAAKYKKIDIKLSNIIDKGVYSETNS